LVESERPGRFTISCVEGGRIVALRLRGSPLFLLVKHEIDVVGGECHTASYGYRLATGQAKDDWLLRWEYFRRPPRPDYPYPQGHLHVNGSLAWRGRALPKLHVPTGRIPLEEVLRHLIVEWGVKPKQDDWGGLLEKSIENFERNRRAP
jgi:hypothetical protein